MNRNNTLITETAFTIIGFLLADGPLPSVLQEVAVPVINNSVCEGMYRNAGYIEHIPHIFICAGWRKGGFDSCEVITVITCVLRHLSTCPTQFYLFSLQFPVFSRESRLVMTRSKALFGL